MLEILDKLLSSIIPAVVLAILFSILISASVMIPRKLRLNRPADKKPSIIASMTAVLNYRSISKKRKAEKDEFNALYDYLCNDIPGGDIHIMLHDIISKKRKAGKDEFNALYDYLCNDIPGGDIYIILYDIKYLKPDPEEIRQNLGMLETHLKPSREGMRDREAVLRTVVEAAHQIIAELCEYSLEGDHTPTIERAIREVLDKSFDIYVLLIPHLPQAHFQRVVDNVEKWLRSNVVDGTRDGAVAKLLIPSLQHIVSHRTAVLGLLYNLWGERYPNGTSEFRAWSSQVKATIQGISHLLASLGPEQVCQLLSDSFDEIVSLYPDTFLPDWQFSVISTRAQLSDEQKEALKSKIQNCNSLDEASKTLLGSILAD